MQELIQTELKKFDAVVPKIEQIKAEYMPLRISGIDDEDGYDAVSKALKFMVAKRNEVESKRKELKADSLAFGKAVDQRAKDITAMLEPIETHLREQKNIIDQEIKRIEDEKIATRQAALNNRINKLMSIRGMWQTITEFVWSSRLGKEEITFMKINLETFDDENFNRVYENIKVRADVEQAEIDRLEAERIAEAQKQEQERIRIQAEREEIEAQQAEILRQKNEIVEQEAEIKRDALRKIGLKLVNSWWEFRSIFGVNNLVNDDDLKAINRSDWEQRLKEYTEIIDGIKKDEIRAEAQRQTEMRKKIEAEQAAQREAEERQKIEKAQKEAEILARRGDAKLLYDYLISIKDYADQHTPSVLKTSEGKRLQKDFMDALNEFIRRVSPTN